ncbi:MAG TPA: ABC transporter permease [Dehalococcoidia bacterium]|nr:ABC transporter permease [Dehalococcoidia bacterium]
MSLPLRYSLRSAIRRRTTFLLTVTGIAVAVSIFVMMLTLVQGLASTMAETGNPRNLVLMRRGAISEATSALSREDANIIANHPAVTASSAEALLLWTTETPGKGMRMVPFRGVSAGSRDIHQVRILEGRPPGQGEAMVGQALLRGSPDLKVGSHVHWGRRDWTISGVFEAGGAVFESEIWGDVEEVLDDDRRTTYSSATVRLKDDVPVTEAIKQLEADKRLSVHAEQETAYYRAQAGSSKPILALSMVVAVLMGVASIFGLINTVQSSLSSRRREIAILQALGFPASNVALSFVLEAMMQATLGGALGGVLGMLLAAGRDATMLNTLTFASVGFQLHPDGRVFAAGMIYSLLVGALASLWPALSASRVPITVGLKQ